MIPERWLQMTFPRLIGMANADGLRHGARSLRCSLRSALFRFMPGWYRPYHRQHPANPVVWMEISVGTYSCGSVVIELFADAVPMAAENFRLLCEGGKTVDGRRATYAGSCFHRLVRRSIIQGGDWERGDGRGGQSAFGGVFRDELLTGKSGVHWGPGCVSMANEGPHTNGAQFFFCLTPAHHLNGKHVVVGQVLQGWELLMTAEREGATALGHPRMQVRIDKCGVALKDAPVGAGNSWWDDVARGKKEEHTPMHVGYGNAAVRAQAAPAAACAAAASAGQPSGQTASSRVRFAEAAEAEAEATRVAAERSMRWGKGGGGRSAGASMRPPAAASRA
eukprot:TRINITY_DN60547_c0_g1_i1.p1 TRINITY_DN60547_c0_g1~~TRINITY_DN60547_c0_g1_i1.p1  ORF type:complete len:336 (+),score=68.91 TRINITY_DN60547_c0_g1_i1:82-1089(+)